MLHHKKRLNTTIIDTKTWIENESYDLQNVSAIIFLEIFAMLDKMIILLKNILFL